MSRRLLLDDGRNQRELVVRDKMTIGRDPACDVSDADPRLSRRHAEFLMTPRGLMVRDLDSRNGVRVNGRMVQEALLTAGDLGGAGALVGPLRRRHAIGACRAGLPVRHPLGHRAPRRWRACR